MPARLVSPDPPRWFEASLPCSLVVTATAVTAPRAEKFSVLLRFFASPLAPLFEGLRSPHLKLVAKADKCDVILQIGVAAKAFRKDDTAIPVDAENLDVAVECDREFVSLVRIVRQACEKPIDLLRKSLAACIECRSIDRGVAIDAADASLAVAVTFEDGSERRGN